MQTAQTIYSYTHKMSCVSKFLLFVLQHAPGADSMLNALYSIEISYVPGIIFLYFWDSQNFILQVCIIPFPAVIMKQNHGCENHTHDLASNCRQDLQYINISAFWDVYSCLWEVKISYN